MSLLYNVKWIIWSIRKRHWDIPIRVVVSMRRFAAKKCAQLDIQFSYNTEVPFVAFNKAEGPRLHKFDNSIRSLTYTERVVLKLGLTNALKLEYKDYLNDLEIQP